VKKIEPPEKIILKYLIKTRNNIMVIKENVNLILKHKFDKLNDNDKILSLEIINLANQLIENIYWSLEKFMQEVDIVNIKFLRSELFEKYNELIDKYKKLVNSITKR
jgi:hypothetical protein